MSVAGGDPAFRTGCVDFHGVHKTVNLAFAPDAGPGAFVLVHAGVAIARLGEEEAQETYGSLADLAAFDEEARAATGG